MLLFSLRTNQHQPSATSQPNGLKIDSMIQVASKCSKKKGGWLFFFQFITFLWTTNQSYKLAQYLRKKYVRVITFASENGQPRSSCPGMKHGMATERETKQGQILLDSSSAIAFFRVAAAPAGRGGVAPALGDARPGAVNTHAAGGTKHSRSRFLPCP
jgi:hypothetical protein